MQIELVKTPFGWVARDRRIGGAISKAIHDNLIDVLNGKPIPVEVAELGISFTLRSPYRLEPPSKRKSFLQKIVNAFWWVLFY